MDFSREVEHSDRLVVRGDMPFNAEPVAAALVEFKYTPEELIYCRNHSPVYDLDENEYKVKVDGLVREPLQLSINELRESFTQRSVVAALQCAGNRRKEMAEIKEVKGITWDNGVIANCRWTGVSLRDILVRANIDESQGRPAHVWFASHVSKCQDDNYYGASIPLEKAMDPDVLLALGMNGETLSPDHGYPLRVVVPGYTGARWVKWVDRITVEREESPNFYQQRDYKVLPSEVETKAEAETFWDKIPSITSLAVNSIIASISPSRFLDDEVVLKGYAMGSGGEDGRVDGVQICISADDDEDETWSDAQITYQEGQWSWTLWECAFDVSAAKKKAMEKGNSEVEFLCRARDKAGRQQQRDCPWNLRGVAYNAYGRATWRL